MEIMATWGCVVSLVACGEVAAAAAAEGGGGGGGGPASGWAGDVRREAILEGDPRLGEGRREAWMTWSRFLRCKDAKRVRQVLIACLYQYVVKDGSTRRTCEVGVCGLCGVEMGT